MAEPNDEVAAGADGRRLRASHADREQVIEVLKAAFVQGRLDRDEFDLRVGRALASRTYADLAALTADIIPARLTRARPPEPAREVGEQEKESSRGAYLRDPRDSGHAGRTAADTGRVAFCHTGHRGHVRLVRGRVDRVASAAPRMV